MYFQILLKRVENYGILYILRPFCKVSGPLNRFKQSSWGRIVIATERIKWKNIIQEINQLSILYTHLRMDRYSTHTGLFRTWPKSRQVSRATYFFSVTSPRGEHSRRFWKNFQFLKVTLHFHAGGFHVLTDLDITANQNAEHQWLSANDWPLWGHWQACQRSPSHRGSP